MRSLVALDFAITEHNGAGLPPTFLLAASADTKLTPIKYMTWNTARAEIFPVRTRPGQTSNFREILFRPLYTDFCNERLVNASRRVCEAPKTGSRTRCEGAPAPYSIFA